MRDCREEDGGVQVEKQGATHSLQFLGLGRGRRRGGLMGVPERTLDKRMGGGGVCQLPWPSFWVLWGAALMIEYQRFWPGLDLKNCWENGLPQVLAPPSVFLFDDQSLRAPQLPGT